MRFTELMNLSLAPSWRRFLSRWYQWQEDHALICASTEAKREKEHRANIKHYQQRAAIFRSKRNSL